MCTADSRACTGHRQEHCQPRRPPRTEAGVASLTARAHGELGRGPQGTHRLHRGSSTQLHSRLRHPWPGPEACGKRSGRVTPGSIAEPPQHCFCVRPPVRPSVCLSGPIWRMNPKPGFLYTGMGLGWRVTGQEPRSLLQRGWAWAAARRPGRAAAAAAALRHSRKDRSPRELPRQHFLVSAVRVLGPHRGNRN